MRCPKCGAFLEEGRTKCFMCGADLTSLDNEPPVQNNFNPTQNNVQKSYNDIELSQLQKQDKDIFDFFHEHKKGIRIFIILVILAVGGFVGYKVYNNIKNPETKPVFNQLYYEISDEFQNTNNSNTIKVYTMSGQKGVNCSISLSSGTNTDGNHAKTYFDGIYEKLAPKEKDDEPVDINEQIERKESEFNQNNSTWSFMNIYYRNPETLEFSIMRYQYLTAMYQGYYYDIELMNYSNDLQCTNALDLFKKTLQFID